MNWSLDWSLELTEENSGWIWILGRSTKLFQSPGIYCPLAYVRTHLVSFGPLTEAHPVPETSPIVALHASAPARSISLNLGFVSLSVFFTFDPLT